MVDPSFTDTLPPRVTAFTGIDAFTHAVECYIGKKASPITDVIALKAIELIACNLKSARDDGTDKKVRDKVALGSLFAGITITNSGTGGVHALAYPLGSIFGIPHGLANAMMLPYVSQFNMPACASRFAEVAKQMGIITKDLSIKETANEAVLAIRKLVEDMQISTRLRDVGIKRDDISALTKLAAKITRLLDNNPRRMEIADIERIYKDAF
ncbi:MAG: iron-containing alcohol dehydrogenase [Candidatus Aerophobetes bacterium]|nr:iron-containing alcohol dehydrogenase [Candidatus Aerophobetes bacterium]